MNLNALRTSNILEDQLIATLAYDNLNDSGIISKVYSTIKEEKSWLDAIPRTVGACIVSSLVSPFFSKEASKAILGTDIEIIKQYCKLLQVTFTPERILQHRNFLQGLQSNGIRTMNYIMTIWNNVHYVVPATLIGLGIYTLLSASSTSPTDAKVVEASCSLIGNRLIETRQNQIVRTCAQAILTRRDEIKRAIKTSKLPDALPSEIERALKPLFDAAQQALG